jgi:transcriptional regulator with XRE-family HTH domain
MTLVVMAELRTLIGQRIAEARQTAGLTQEELAERVGLAAENLSRAERGRSMLKTETLIAVADVLGVSIDDLARGREVTPKPVGISNRTVSRLIRRLESLDDETAVQATKLLTLFLRAVESRRRKPSR